MKRLAGILLSLVFLVQSFGYILVYTSFELNRNYIARNLCINRDRPEMHCNGHCQLCKMMHKEEKKENTGFPGAKELKPVILFAFEINKFISPDPMMVEFRNTPYAAGVSSVHKPGVFHPPVV